MRPIGFSTGAIAKGNFIKALVDMPKEANAVEVSALREKELQPLLKVFSYLEPFIDRYDHFSFHAPNYIKELNEIQLVSYLKTVADYNIPIIVHPTVITETQFWHDIEHALYIENMDHKKYGRTPAELEELFAALPKANFCLDLAHAYFIDPSLKLAQDLIQFAGSRLKQVHISVINKQGQHNLITPEAYQEFQSIAHLIPKDVPIILETTPECMPGQIELIRGL